MLRIQCPERPDWRSLADEYGFDFHTLYGQPYWDETAYYQFSLRQIEDDIEDPSAELHQMCLQVVDRVVNDETLLTKFCIPPSHWDFVRNSWRDQEPSLYARLDLAYDGYSPVKLYENNADTPTSLYETGFWQWLWLEERMKDGLLHQTSDQFNSLQEKLINRLFVLKFEHPDDVLYLACCQDSVEDRGTVQYLEDCAKAAGISTRFINIEDIGLSNSGDFTDLEDNPIRWIFKLYPWEFILGENYASSLITATTSWIEPPWKALLSNKALLPALWQQFPNHPNLLPAYFEDDPANDITGRWVKKPIFSREGANIQISDANGLIESSDGPYGDEGFIIQAYQPLSKFDGNYTLVGSWLINDQPAGMSIREDTGLITQDTSRYLPHVIWS